MVLEHDAVQIRMSIAAELIRSGEYKHDENGLIAGITRISQTVLTGTDPNPAQTNPPGTGSSAF